MIEVKLHMYLKEEHLNNQDSKTPRHQLNAKVVNLFSRSANST